MTRSRIEARIELKNDIALSCGGDVARSGRMVSRSDGVEVGLCRGQLPAAWEAAVLSASTLPTPSQGNPSPILPK